MKQIYESKIPKPQFTVPFSRYVHLLVTLVKTHPKIPGPTDTIGSEQQSIPFSYVRRLIVYGTAVGVKENRAYLEVLWLFTNVTDLQICNWNFQQFESSEITKWFEHFGGTVRTLHIRSCRCNTAVLIFLKSLFPSADDLLIRPAPASPSCKYTIQDSDRTRMVEFRGKLTFDHLDEQHDGFLTFVSKNCIDVHSITLVLCWRVGTQELFDQCQAGLTSVGFGTQGREGRCIHVCQPTSLHIVLTIVLPRHHSPLILHSTPNLNDSLLVLPVLMG